MLNIYSAIQTPILDGILLPRHYAQRPQTPFGRGLINGSRQSYPASKQVFRTVGIRRLYIFMVDFGALSFIVRQACLADSLNIVPGNGRTAHPACHPADAVR